MILEKYLKKTDYIIMAAIVLILTVVIYVCTNPEKTVGSSPVVAENDITFTVYLKSVSLTNNEELFKAGEQTFLTIRNVPYKKLEIISAEQENKKMMLQGDVLGKYEIYPDIINPYDYNITVTVKDKAKITDDGAVIGGNKIKIGIPVVLEGQTYKLNGVVSDIDLKPDFNDGTKAVEVEKIELKGDSQE